MDFKNLNGVWKVKKICRSCIELIFKFCLGEFCFQLEFFFGVDFQMHKTHLKALFLRFWLSEITVRSFISLMAKFGVYDVFRF